ncbi:MAG: GNAT family N-acetyltransferase [Alphaproteobacteria bacterium]|nr:GNAT family N-acetyltransferase [Alphaproteobacteria bacterium]
MTENSAHIVVPFVGRDLVDEPVAAPARGGWTATVSADHTRLETAWRALERDGFCTAFQTYDWVDCWYQAMTGSDVEPVVVLVQDQNGEPLWILPLCLRRCGKTRIIAFADMGLADYAAPVMARSTPSDAASIRAIFREILRALPTSDLIHFEKLADRVGEMSNPLLHLPGRVPFPVSSHGIRLRGPWPELAEEIVQRRLFSTIRRQRNRLGKVGEITVEPVTAPGDMKPLLERLIEMRDARFTGMGIPAMPPAWRKFYYDLAQRQGPSLDQSIYTLRVSGELIAACYGFARGNHYYGILPSFEMGKWEKFRPGMQLFYFMLTDFADRTDGKGYFDFTIGDEVYKSRMGCEAHPLYEWAMPRRAAGLLPFTVLYAKAALRRHPGLYDTIRQGVKRFHRDPPEPQTN